MKWSLWEITNMKRHLIKRSKHQNTNRSRNGINFVWLRHLFSLPPSEEKIHKIGLSIISNIIRLWILIFFIPQNIFAQQKCTLSFYIWMLPFKIFFTHWCRKEDFFSQQSCLSSGFPGRRTAVLKDNTLMLGKGSEKGGRMVL